MRPVRALTAAMVLAATASTAGGESPACEQGRRLVVEARRQLAAGAPDHDAIHWTLNTARNLCPSLPEAWVLASCVARARGEESDAAIFERRARLLGADPACPRQGLAPAESQEPLPAFVRDKFALVVGIGSFRDAKIPPLRFAAKDARDLAAALTDPAVGRFPPGNVKVLTDADATRGNILNALQDLFVRAREEDLVLLFLSSHGSPRREAGGLGGVGYLVTHDTSLENIWLDAIDYEGFSSKAGLIRARRKVVFLDTCYSGLAAAGEKALTVEAAGVDAGTAGGFLSGEGSYVITSSHGDERSYESEALANGYFTYYLLRALRRPGEPPDLREVFESLSRDVPEAVARDKRAAQTPQMFPADSPGDLRIGVAPRNHAEAAAPASETGGELERRER